jgi:hypothetical protein
MKYQGSHSGRPPAPSLSLHCAAFWEGEWRTLLGALLADRSLPQLGEDNVRFGKIPQFSTWACGRPPSSPKWWVSSILWERTALRCGPRAGYCKPTGHAFALAVKCHVLDRLSRSDWERYVGLFASEVAGGCCLASYPNHLLFLSNSSLVPEGLCSVGTGVGLRDCVTPRALIRIWVKEHHSLLTWGDCFSFGWALGAGWGRFLSGSGSPRDSSWADCQSCLREPNWEFAQAEDTL